MNEETAVVIAIVAGLFLIASIYVLSQDVIDKSKRTLENPGFVDSEDSNQQETDFKPENNYMPEDRALWVEKGKEMKLL